MGAVRRSVHKASTLNALRKQQEAKLVQQAGAHIAEPTVPKWIVNAADLLHDSEPLKREDAARRLRDKATEIFCFTPFFAGALAVVLRKDEVPRVRFAAAQAISALGCSAGKPYGKDLATALQLDACSQVREAAARGLGMVGGHLEDLGTVALDDGFADVRRQAAQALGCSGPAASEQVGAWADTLATHSFHVMRCRAATALGDAGSKASGPYAEALATAALMDTAVGVRLEAARALVKLGDVAAAPGIAQLTAALQEEDPQRRKRAARALGAIGEALQDEKVVKQRAEEAETRTPTDRSVLSEDSLGRQMPRRRRTGPETGKKVAASGDILRLAESISNSTDAGASPKRKGRRLRIQTDLDAPASTEDAPAVTPAAEVLVQAALDAALHDSDFFVRQTASEAVGSFGAAAAADPGKLDSALEAMVATALQSESPECRSRASEALGNMGDLRTTHAEAITAVLDDGDPIKQLRAVEALQDLGTPCQLHRKKLLSTLQRGQTEDVRTATTRAMSMMELRPRGISGKRSVTYGLGQELIQASRLRAEVAALQTTTRCVTPPHVRPEAALFRRARLPVEYSLAEVEFNGGPFLKRSTSAVGAL